MHFLTENTEFNTSPLGTPYSIHSNANSKNHETSVFQAFLLHDF